MSPVGGGLITTTSNTVSPLVLVLVGLGPRGSGLLERVVSQASAGGGGPVQVHLVDPFPPGGGRVWRDAQSGLLRLNTTAEDLTAFVDDSVALTGPVTAGPTLFEWCRTHGVDLDDPALADEAASLGALDFPSRRLANAYFTFAHERALSRTPVGVTVLTHAQRAVDIVSVGEDRELVVLEDGEVIAADAVVLANSHVDVRPAPPFAALAAFADGHDLTYVPPGYGGDLDLAHVTAGQDVLVRGFGLGFIDLMVLLTEGRGGRFVDSEAGLRYLPSGAEPHLWVGSRRGVPYHSKPMYRLQAAKPTITTFCTPAAIARLLDRGSPINFIADVWPLIAQEVSWVYYQELGLGHPGRLAVSWPEFSATFAALEWGSAAYDRWIEDVVPEPTDRLDLLALDRPLEGRRVGDRVELSELVREHVRSDLSRRCDVKFSADLGAFFALLAVLPVIGPVLASPLMDPRSLLDDFFGWFIGFFSFYASGPPPDRLEQLLALEQAGILSFLGAGLRIEADPEREVFVAESSTIDGEVTARALIDATLPAFNLDRTTDPLLAALAGRGEAVSQVFSTSDGDRLDTGQLLVDRTQRLVGADGASAPRRFALGMHTTVKAAAFARPGSNGPVHRLNDQVAATLLALPRSASPEAASSGSASPQAASPEAADPESAETEAATPDTDGGHTHFAPQVALSGARGR